MTTMITLTEENTRMQFAGKWGHFEENGRCYVIERPDTPQPWPNYLFSRDAKFTASVSQRAQGALQYVAPAANLVSEGRNYCLLDKDTGRCWSANAGAAPEAATYYRCEHRPGRTVFKGEHCGIATTLTICLDTDTYVEVNRLTMTNTSSQVRQLSVIGCHETRLKGIRNDNQIEHSFFDDASGAVIVQRYHFDTAKYKYAAFYRADRRPESYCGSKDAFYDADVSPDNITAWRTGTLANLDAYATTPIQALQHSIMLNPGQSVTINYHLGIADDLDEINGMLKSVGDADSAMRADNANMQMFDELLANSPIKLDDPVCETMFNVWAKVQLYRQVTTARGSTVNNWRNNLQDAWGWMVFDATWAKHYLRQMCSLAKADGFLMRTSARVPELAGNHYLHQRHNDIATWAGTLAARYAAETGDLAFFSENVQYADNQKTATVIECLINAIRWLLEHRGQHGMILMLDGDWSDPLEEAGKKGIGESPWTSAALVETIRNLNPLLKKLGFEEVAAEFDAASQQLTQAVNEHAWDGGWYIRGITDAGIRFCTSTDPDANVSLMMQAWAILSGIVPQDRMPQVLEAIDTHVKTDSGPILYGPPFLKWRPEIGRETVKRPGTGENGSCYVHSGMMLAMAEIRAGRPDEALKLVKQVFPLRQPDCTETTRAIPLWCPNFWHGPHSKRPGLSSGIISTGAPAWYYLVVCEGFLGIQPELEGLRIAPQFPSCWKAAKFERNWKGRKLLFDFVRNSADNNVAIEVNGYLIKGNTIAEPEENRIHYIKVSIG